MRLLLPPHPHLRQAAISATRRMEGEKSERREQQQKPLYFVGKLPGAVVENPSLTTGQHAQGSDGEAASSTSGARWIAAVGLEEGLEQATPLETEEQALVRTAGANVEDRPTVATDASIVAGMTSTNVLGSPKTQKDDEKVQVVVRAWRKGSKLLLRLEDRREGVGGDGTTRGFSRGAATGAGGGGLFGTGGCVIIIHEEEVKRPCVRIHSFFSSL